MISLSSPPAVTLLEQLMESPSLLTMPMILLYLRSPYYSNKHRAPRQRQAKMITADLFQEPIETKTFSQLFCKRKIQVNWKCAMHFEKEEDNKNLKCSLIQLTLLRKTLLWLEMHRENNFWANILIAHVYKNGLMKVFMDFWSRQYLKNWQRGVSWSWEKLGSGRQLQKAWGHWNKKAVPLAPQDCKPGGNSKCTPINFNCIDKVHIERSMLWGSMIPDHAVLQHAQLHVEACGKPRVKGQSGGYWQFCKAIGGNLLLC